MDVAHGQQSALAQHGIVAQRRPFFIHEKPRTTPLFLIKKGPGHTWPGPFSRNKQQF